MRLELTQRVDLAIRALQELARQGDATPTKGTDLAAALGTTPTYLPQVLRPVVQRGWVMSEPGPTGGYRLATPLASIPLLSLIEAIEGPTDDGRCVLRNSECDADSPCALHVPWIRARDALLRELDATPLSALDGSEG